MLFNWIEAALEFRDIIHIMDMEKIYINIQLNIVSQPAIGIL